MEYNYKELFPKLADGKGGTDGDLNQRYKQSIDDKWKKEFAKVEALNGQDAAIVDRFYFHKCLDLAIDNTWTATDRQLDDWLDAADSFPEEVIDYGEVTCNDGNDWETYSCKINYWSAAYKEVQRIEKHPSLSDWKDMPLEDKSWLRYRIHSGLGGWFAPLAKYCAQLDENPVGDASSLLFPHGAVLAVSLWLLLVGQHAEAGAGFIPSTLKDLFLPLLIVAVVSGIKALLSLLYLIRAPKTKKEIRQELEWIAKIYKMAESLAAIRRRLAYYHLWIDSGLLSENGKVWAQETVTTLETWVSRYEADRAKRKS